MSTTEIIIISNNKVITTFQGDEQLCRNGSGEKGAETRLFQSTKHTSHMTAEDLWGLVNVRSMLC